MRPWALSCPQWTRGPGDPVGEGGGGPGDCFACPGSRAELSKLKPAGALCSPALSQGGPSRRTQDLPLHCCASNVLAWICTLLAGDSSWGGAKEGHSHSHLIPSASMGECASRTTFRVTAALPCAHTLHFNPHTSQRLYEAGVLLSPFYRWNGHKGAPVHTASGWWNWNSLSYSLYLIPNWFIFSIINHNGS